MRKVLILGLALALVGGVAYANYCARDYVPASSLLVPYAVVDLAGSAPDPAGYTTLFAVTNVSSAAELVHFTVWDAKSNHVVDWDELLTGYDVWTINFRDLLTGHFDFFDTGSARLLPEPPAGPPPYGPTSNSYTVPLPVPQDPNPATLSCSFPYGYLPSLGPTIVQKLQDAINAQVVQLPVPCRPGTPMNPPWLTGLTKAPVFFYVTADVVNICSTVFPDQPAYWSTTGTNPLTGVAFTRIPANRNVIIGDIIYVNSTTNYSESIPAVSLESDPVYRVPTLTAFYDRYAHAVPAEDDREPLATAFGFRYINSVAATQVMVWKDSMEADNGSKTAPPSSANRGITLACAPYLYYAFDNDENALARGGGGPSGFDIAEPNVIPFETQSAPLNQANWDGLPAQDGWMMLVFDFIASSATTVGHQAWVGVRYLAGGYSSSVEAATLGNYNCFVNQVLPGLGINVAGVGTFPMTSVYLP